MGFFSLLGGLNRAIARIMASVIDNLIGARFSHYISRDLVRYGVCGVVNYILLDALLYFVVYHYVVGSETFVDINFVVISPHTLSLMIVFPITFLTGFWLNRYVAFRSTDFGVGRQITRYAISISGSIVLSYLSLKFFVENLDLLPTVAKILSSITTATYSYLMARLFTFQRSANQPSKK